MQFNSVARADRRALMGAALIGASVGLALGAAYLAGGLGQAAIKHARAERLATNSAAPPSDIAMQQEAAGADAGVVNVAYRHDPSSFAAAAERDRRDGVLAARLERRVASARPGGPLERSRDLDCLTQAVYFEARGETPAGQAAVAQVVLNRVRHPAFPKTVCGVVYQGAGGRGCQFSFACDGSLHARREGAAWDRARRVAGRALAGVVMGEVGQATHFHTTGVAPTWGPRLLRVAQVGVHVFYRFGRTSGGSFLRAPPEPANPPVQAGLPAAPAQIRLAAAVLQTPTETAVLTSLPIPAEPAKAGARPAATPVDVSAEARLARPPIDPRPGAGAAL